MKVIKVKCCNDCPFFKRIGYLHNQPKLCSENYNVMVFDSHTDIYNEVHSDCPLEDL